MVEKNVFIKKLLKKKRNIIQDVVKYFERLVIIRSRGVNDIVDGTLNTYSGMSKKKRS